MDFITKVRVLHRMHTLIARQATGCPLNFAQKLGVSRTALYRYIDALKGLNAPIAYCKDRQCYYYDGDFDFLF